jgi:hypothetical protein
MKVSLACTKVAPSFKTNFSCVALKLVQMKTNLEAQMLSVESANISLVAQEGMQLGLNAQRQVTRNLKPDEVAELHQDIEDHLNQADEASKILAGTFNAGEVFDEDELLAELAAELSNQGETRDAKKAAPKHDDDVEDLNRLMASTPRRVSAFFSLGLRGLSLSRAILSARMTSAVFTNRPPTLSRFWQIFALVKYLT